jgi:hypothetical protein
VSVPGPVNPTEAVGIKDAAEGPATNIPPPPGFGGNTGQGGGVESDLPGKGSMIGYAGGMGGPVVAGGFGGRSGATREQMLREGGGNSISEAAVARGLKWLSLHQAGDGRWSTEAFAAHGKCNCGGTSTEHPIAGACFGLLPFLGAGETHKKGLYSKNVDRGLTWLLSKQQANGSFSGSMYENGLALIAVSEAYALTSDNKLKVAAQKAVNFVASAQTTAGGWDYGPGGGAFDTSVGGWNLMGLKSAQMAGLSVPKTTLGKVNQWLDAAASPTGAGYGYRGPGADSASAMTAVGLLCREYMGWGPRNPALAKGVDILNASAAPSSGLNNMYYYYYATQVCHHFGGKAWDKWNVRMRDALIADQDKGNDPKKAHQKGSWDCKDFAGRLMSTSLCLLTLEVYYRHLPLYRRDMNDGKKS